METLSELQDAKAYARGRQFPSRRPGLKEALEGCASLTELVSWCMRFLTADLHRCPSASTALQEPRESGQVSDLPLDIWKPS